LSTDPRYFKYCGVEPCNTADIAKNWIQGRVSVEILNNLDKTLKYFYIFFISNWIPKRAHFRRVFNAKN
jgi:hypothetical protein